MAGSGDLSGGESRLVLGRVGKAHGVRGWVKLHSFTEPADNILEYPLLLAEFNNRLQRLHIDQASRHGNGLLVHFEGIDDPESARSLIGAELSVDRKQLPVLEAGEYYWHELVGMQVHNRAGENLGIVQRLLETGANDVLVVAPSAESIDERERLIPYLADSVIERVDREEGQILVDWPADYLV